MAYSVVVYCTISNDDAFCQKQNNSNFQVFDLYQLKKQKAAPLTSQDIVFTKLDPTEGVKVGFG